MVSETRARAQSDFAHGPARARGTRSLPGLDLLRWSWTRAPSCLLPGPASSAGLGLKDITKHILLSMSNMRLVLERQQREDEEIRLRRAEEDRELDEEEDEVILAVSMLNQSRQHHHGRVSKVDRHRHSQGLFPEQKLTAALRMLAYGAFADQVDKITRMRKSTILECLVRFYDAIETLYTRATNLRLGTSKGFYNKPRLEVVASFDKWVWRAFLGVSGSQNDLNVLGQSPVSNDVLKGHSP
ncbi:hypothetical protein L3X38_043393 [Prunus dulcis]|uniref:Uncharacterized protein n=1 Tax=Prunus dulcis TaxID=3755 RepID=A0AAD4UYC9_PRUDU|nr:hypothetical protein L3X38_043393 [Prunus dulcis]